MMFPPPSSSQMFYDYYNINGHVICKCHKLHRYLGPKKQRRTGKTFRDANNPWVQHKSQQETAPSTSFTILLGLT